MVLHRPVELAGVIGKFDRSGVSGSTGRGRSQALESKVRFADHPGVIAWPLKSERRVLPRVRREG